MLECRACVKALRVLRQRYSVSHWLGNAGSCGFHAQSSVAHENATAYDHSNCKNVAMHQRKFNFSTTHAGFMQVSKNEGENHTNIMRQCTIPVEETEVLFDQIGELQTFAGNNSRFGQKEHPRKRVGFGEETNILVDVVLKLKNSKEAVYGTLDSWVAREDTFPSNVLKRALYMLEKKQQWHKIIQVIKWMMSKGQCMTMNTYEQLIRALEKDHRAEEAHAFWEARIGSNLHSVPWQLCTYMICMYQRNSMPERIIKLFNDLELYNRKPPDKTIIKMVADAFELLGLKEKQQRVLEKYCNSSNNRSKKKKDKLLQDCNGENADRLSGVLSPTDSELPIENILSNCDARSNSNGSMDVSIESEHNLRL